MFWLASLTVADEPSLWPTLRLARASSGMVGAVNAARPIPTHDSPGWWPPTTVADRLDADVGGEQEVARGDQLLRPALGRLASRGGSR